LSGRDSKEFGSVLNQNGHVNTRIISQPNGIPRNRLDSSHRARGGGLGGGLLRGLRLSSLSKAPISSE